MILTEPQPTPYDLRFRLFGTPVRVHPLFWLISVALGWPSHLPDESRHLVIPLALVWVGCVFVSILLHEMGHVLMGRLFGSNGHIVLYSFGGLAIGSANLGRGWQRALVSFAGPLAQFLFLIPLLLYMWYGFGGDRLEAMHPLARSAIFDLLYINLFWPIFNLLPIWPLDGGQISREGFQAILGARGVRLSLGLSLVFAALLAANAFVVATRGTPLIPIVGYYVTGTYMALFFALMAWSNYQALQALEAQRRWTDDHLDG